MFENLLEKFLLGYLGDYVEFDREKLRVGIWSGKVTLENVSLKQQALEKLEMPVKVTTGFIESLRVQIPWSNIWGEPVQVFIDGVYALAEPQAEFSEMDHEAALKYARAIKQRKIVEAESIREMVMVQRLLKDEQKEASEKEASLIQALVKTIINNVQLTIRNVHVRYEDRKFLSKMSSFSFGIVFDEVSAHTTDKDGNMAFAPARDCNLLFKKVLVKNFRIYWFPESSSFSGKSVGKFQILDNLKTSAQTVGHSFQENMLIFPLSLSFTLCLNNTMKDLSIPKYSMFLVINHIHFQLTQTQYHSIVSTLEALTNIKRKADVAIAFSSILKGNISRSSEEESVQVRAKDYWKYAIACARAIVKNRRSMRMNWGYISEQIKIRKSYISKYRLYILSKKEKDIMECKESLLDLEDALDVETIMLYRRLAKAEIEEEKSLALKSNPQKGTWSSWFGFGLSSSMPNASSSQLDSAQRKQIDSLVQYESILSETKAPSDYIYIHFSAKVDKVFAQVQSLDMESSTSENIAFQDLLSISFSCNLNHDIYPNSIFESSLRVSDFDVLAQGDSSFQVRCSDSSKNDFFTLTADSKKLISESPTKPPESMEICIELAHGLEIVYDKYLLDKVTKFLTISSTSLLSNNVDAGPPQTHYEQLSLAANAWKESRQLEFIDSLNDHSMNTITIRSGPLRLVLFEPNPPKNIVVEVGAFDLKSLSKSQYQESVFSREIDPKSLKFYDIFALSLWNCSIHLEDNGVRVLDIISKYNFHSQFFLAMKPAILKSLQAGEELPKLYRFMIGLLTDSLFFELGTHRIKVLNQLISQFTSSVDNEIGKPISLTENELSHIEHFSLISESSNVVNASASPNSTPVDEFLDGSVSIFLAIPKLKLSVLSDYLTESDSAFNVYLENWNFSMFSKNNDSILQIESKITGLNFVHEVSGLPFCKLISQKNGNSFPDYFFSVKGTLENERGSLQKRLSLDVNIGSFVLLWNPFSIASLAEGMRDYISFSRNQTHDTIAELDRCGNSTEKKDPLDNLEFDIQFQLNYLELYFQSTRESKEIMYRQPNLDSRYQLFIKDLISTLSLKTSLNETKKLVFVTEFADISFDDLLLSKKIKKELFRLVRADSGLPPKISALYESDWKFSISFSKPVFYITPSSIASMMMYIQQDMIAPLSNLSFGNSSEVRESNASNLFPFSFEMFVENATLAMAVSELENVDSTSFLCVNFGSIYSKVKSDQEARLSGNIENTAVDFRRIYHSPYNEDSMNLIEDVMLTVHWSRSSMDVSVSPLLLKLDLNALESILHHVSCSENTGSFLFLKLSSFESHAIFQGNNSSQNTTFESKPFDLFFSLEHPSGMSISNLPRLEITFKGQAVYDSHSRTSSLRSTSLKVCLDKSFDLSVEHGTFDIIVEDEFKWELAAHGQKIVLNYQDPLEMVQCIVSCPDHCDEVVRVKANFNKDMQMFDFFANSLECYWSFPVQKAFSEKLLLLSEWILPLIKNFHGDDSPVHENLPSRTFKFHLPDLQIKFYDSDTLQPSHLYTLSLKTKESQFSISDSSHLDLNCFALHLFALSSTETHQRKVDLINCGNGAHSSSFLMTFFFSADYSSFDGTLSFDETYFSYSKRLIYRLLSYLYVDVLELFSPGFKTNAYVSRLGLDSEFEMNIVSGRFDHLSIDLNSRKVPHDEMTLIIKPRAFELGLTQTDHQSLSLKGETQFELSLQPTLIKLRSKIDAVLISIVKDSMRLLTSALLDTDPLLSPNEDISALDISLEANSFQISLQHELFANLSLAYLQYVTLTGGDVQPASQEFLLQVGGVSMHLADSNFTSKKPNYVLLNKENFRSVYSLHEVESNIALSFPSETLYGCVDLVALPSNPDFRQISFVFSSKNQDHSACTFNLKECVVSLNALLIKQVSVLVNSVLSELSSATGNISNSTSPSTLTFSLSMEDSVLRFGLADVYTSDSLTMETDFALLCLLKDNICISAEAKISKLLASISTMACIHEPSSHYLFNGSNILLNWKLSETMSDCSIQNLHLKSFVIESSFLIQEITFIRAFMNFFIEELTSFMTSTSQTNETQSHSQSPWNVELCIQNISICALDSIDSMLQPLMKTDLASLNLEIVLSGSDQNFIADCEISLWLFHSIILDWEPVVEPSSITLFFSQQFGLAQKNLDPKPSILRVQFSGSKKNQGLSSPIQGFNYKSIPAYTEGVNLNVSKEMLVSIQTLIEKSQQQMLCEIEPSGSSQHSPSILRYSIQNLTRIPIKYSFSSSKSCFYDLEDDSQHLISPEEKTYFLGQSDIEINIVFSDGNFSPLRNVVISRPGKWIHNLVSQSPLNSSFLLVDCIIHEQIFKIVISSCLMVENLTNSTIQIWTGMGKSGFTPSSISLVDSKPAKGNSSSIEFFECGSIGPNSRLFVPLLSINHDLLRYHINGTNIFEFFNRYKLLDEPIIVDTSERISFQVNCRRNQLAEISTITFEYIYTVINSLPRRLYLEFKYFDHSEAWSGYVDSGDSIAIPNFIPKKGQYLRMWIWGSLKSDWIMIDKSTSRRRVTEAFIIGLDGSSSRIRISNQLSTNSNFRREIQFFAPLLIIDKTGLDLNFACQDESENIHRNAFQNREMICEVTERSSLSNNLSFIDQYGRSFASLDEVNLPFDWSWIEDWSIKDNCEANSSMSRNEILPNSRKWLRRCQYKPWMENPRRRIIFDGYGMDTESVLYVKAPNMEWHKVSECSYLPMLDKKFIALKPSYQQSDILNSPFPFKTLDLVLSTGSSESKDVNVGTNAIVITSRFKLMNKFNVPVLVRQEYTGSVNSVDPQSVMDFYFDHLNKSRCVQVSVNGSRWSPFINLEHTTEISLRCFLKNHSPSESNSQWKQVDVTVQFAGSSQVVFLAPGDVNFPPYRILNFSGFDVSFEQVSSSKERGSRAEMASKRTRLLNGSEVVYYLDDPREKSSLIRVLIGNTSFLIDFNKIGHHEKVIFDGKTIRCALSARGRTKILQLLQEGDTLPVFFYPLEREIETDNVGACMAIDIFVERLGLSFISNERNELFYITLDDLSLSMESSESNRKCYFTVGDSQIDNCDLSYSPLFKVIFSTDPNQSRESKYNDTESSRKLPLFQLRFNESFCDPSLSYFKYFGLLIQPSSLRIDDLSLQNMADLFSNLSASTKNDSSSSFKTEYEEISQLTYEYSRMLFFDVLEILPIRLSIDFKSGLQRFSGDQSLNLFNSFSSSAMSLLSTVKDAKIKLNGVRLEKPYVPLGVLVSNLVEEYREKSMHSLFKVVGSLNILGNPVNLLSDIGSGLQDFISEPTEGFLKGPAEFSLGIVKGSTSLVKNTLKGINGSFGGLSSSLGDAVSVLTLDDEYRRKRALREKPNNIVEGTLHAGRHIGMGVVDGIGGFFKAPIQGAKKSGISGFAQGLIKGTFGLAAKPVAGLLDATSSVSEGIQRTGTSASQNAHIMWTRYPRMMYSSLRHLRPYDLTDGYVNFIFHDPEIYKKLEFDSYEFLRRNGQVIYVFFHSCACAIVLSESAPKLVWTEKWKNIRIVCSEDSIYLVSTRKKDSNVRILPDPPESCQELASKLNAIKHKPLHLKSL